MRNKAIEYPHPVLTEYTNDFGECDFSIAIVSHGDNGKDLEFEVQYSLSCPGMMSLIQNGIAKIMLRLVCYRTSFRILKELEIGKNTIITVPKNMVSDSIDLQGVIVATQNYDNYKLAEFNRDYFDGVSFKIRKGAVLANEPGLKIKLNSILEKNASGIVQVTSSPSITEMKVNYATIEETDPALTNEIVITLPDTEYKNYAKIRTKKHLKKNIIHEKNQNRLKLEKIIINRNGLIEGYDLKNYDDALFEFMNVLPKIRRNV